MRAAFVRGGHRRDEIKGRAISLAYAVLDPQFQSVARSVYRGEYAQEWFDAAIQSRIANRR